MTTCTRRDSAQSAAHSYGAAETRTGEAHPARSSLGLRPDELHSVRSASHEKNGFYSEEVVMRDATNVNRRG
ncbi:hypothetical protein GCM10009754_87380 [Amycolatopsis minnesotensis]|uniref:Uncharacterized protein n=1 Tax=Amycolatopsis minnesotensis TaxID=337894 RepID=A0ABN2SYM7_9PSEU